MKKIIINSLTATTLLTALSACGGSGDDDTSVPKIYPKTTTLAFRATDPTVTKPDIDTPTIDPVFKTRIHKVAKADKRIAIYPKRQSWNSDMSLIRIANRLYDNKTLKETAYTKGLDQAKAFQTLCSRASDNFSWSTKDPHTFFVLDNQKHFIQGKINPDNIDCSNTLISFPEYEEVHIGPDEGNIDYQDQYVVFTGKKPNDDQIYLILYDIKNQKTVWDEPKILADDKWHFNAHRNLIEPVYMDWISISPSGKYIVVNNSDKDNYQKGLVRYNRDMTNEKILRYKYKDKLYSEGGHGDMGYDTEGNEVMVEYLGGITVASFNLDKPEELGKYLLKSPYGGGHVSCRNYDHPGWCYVTTQTKGHERVFALKLDGTGDENVQNFSQTHRWTRQYLGSPTGFLETYGSPSPDGTKMIFNSHWDNTEPYAIDTFIAEAVE